MSDTEQFSPFARFFLKLRGYDFFYKRNRIEKFEMYLLGFTNAEDILYGKTEIEKVTRPDRDELLY